MKKLFIIRYCSIINPDQCFKFTSYDEKLIDTIMDRFDEVGLEYELSTLNIPLQDDAVMSKKQTHAYIDMLFA